MFSRSSIMRVSPRLRWCASRLVPGQDFRSRCVIRTALPADQLLELLRTTSKNLDDQITVYSLSTMEHRLA